MVTVFTAGAATGALATGFQATMTAGATALAGGTAAAGAALGAVGLTATTGISVGMAIGASVVGAAVGSMASQLAGKAMGVVDKFSWRQVAASGLTAGLTAGVGAAANAAQAGSWARNAAEAVNSSYSAQGVFNYAASQAINRVVGLDTSFSWSGLAASVAGANVGGYVGNSSGIGGMPGAMIKGQISAHASAAMNDKWFGGSRPNYGQVAADAFGNTLGNYIAREMGKAAELEKQAKLARWTDGEIARAAARTAERLPPATTFAAPADRPLDWTLDDITYDVYAKTAAGDGGPSATQNRLLVARPPSIEGMNWSPGGGYVAPVNGPFNEDVPLMDYSTGEVLDRPYPRRSQARSALDFYDDYAVIPRVAPNGDWTHDLLAGASNVGNIPLNLGGALLGSFAEVMHSTGADQLLDAMAGLPGLAPEARAAKWMLSSITGIAAARAEARFAGALAPNKNTVTMYRVDDNAFDPRIASDGTIPVVTTKKGGERALFVNFGQPERAKEFALVNRNGNATITAVEVDVSLLNKLRATSVHDLSDAAKLNPTTPLKVDIKAPDQFGLRTPEQIQWLRDAIDPSTVRIINPNDL